MKSCLSKIQGKSVEMYNGGHEALVVPESMNDSPLVQGIRDRLRRLGDD